MGQKPSHLSAAASSQDVVWAAIRERKIFTRADIIVFIAGHKYSGISDYTVNSYIQRLVKGGVLAVIESKQVRGVSQLHTYELIKDCGVHAPRFDKSGKRSTSGIGRECMWRAMKMLGEFNAAELVAASSNERVTVQEHEAKYFIKHLFKAGYLHRTHAGTKHTGLSRFRLLPSKNTGPRPPQIQRVLSVYDPNLAQVVWPKSDTEILVDELKS